MRDPDKVRGHYRRNPETGRFEPPQGALEFLRTKEILSRVLPRSRSRILDAGGAVGHYAFWLAELGHEVTLLDLSPEQVESARERNRTAVNPLEAVAVADVRELSFPEHRFDAVLLMGPLYHLQEPADRLLALRNCLKVLRPGGLLVSAYISRFASLMDGFRLEFMEDPVFRAIVDEDLRSGRHNPETDSYFTEAYFHHPDEIEAELFGAGAAEVRLLAVEGPVWTLGNLETWLGSEDRRRILLESLRQIETDRSVIGASAHLLAVSRKAAH